MDSLYWNQSFFGAAMLDHPSRLFVQGDNGWEVYILLESPLPHLKKKGESPRQSFEYFRSFICPIYKNNSV